MQNPEKIYISGYLFRRAGGSWIRSYCFIYTDFSNQTTEGTNTRTIYYTSSENDTTTNRKTLVTFDEIGQINYRSENRRDGEAQIQPASHQASASGSESHSSNIGLMSITAFRHTISVQSSATFQDSNDEAVNGVRFFEIVCTSGAQIHLLAETKRERDRWVRMLKKKVQRKMSDEKAASIITRNVKNWLMLRRMKAFLMNEPEYADGIARNKIIREFIQTESQYKDKLDLVINRFMRPMLSKNIIDAKEAKAIFGNIEQIQHISSTVLDELQHDWILRGAQFVAKVFSKVSVFLKFYGPYICDLEDARNKVAELSGKSPKFLKFLQKTYAQHCSEALPELLAEPGGHISVYITTLSALLQHVAEHTVGYTDLEQALNVVKSVNSHVQEIKRHREGLTRSIQLQKKLETRYKNFIQPGRHYQRNKYMLVSISSAQQGSSTSIAMHIVYIYNDMIVLFKDWSEDNVHLIFFAFAQIVGKDSRQRDDEFQIEAYQAGGRKVFTFRAASVQERETLESEIESFIKQMQEEIRINKSLDEVDWDASWNVVFDKEVKVEKKIGHGAFGNVFRGEWNGDTVAIKIIKSQSISEDNASWLEFKREINVMRRLSNPKILSVLATCFEQPNISMLCEYADKGNLKTLLLSPGTITWNRKIDILMQTAQGMLYLHQQRILHRDLKPENLLLFTSTKEKYGLLVKVADFGMAKVRIHTLTLTGQTGTPCAMAPELLKENTAKIGPPCDVYSFAIVMWETLMRDSAWKGVNWVKVTSLVVSGQRPDITRTPEEYLENNFAESPQYHRYIELMKECWNQEPSERPTFEDIIARLKELYIPDSHHDFEYLAEAQEKEQQQQKEIQEKEKSSATTVTHENRSPHEKKRGSNSEKKTRHSSSADLEVLSADVFDRRNGGKNTGLMSMLKGILVNNEHAAPASPAYSNSSSSSSSSSSSNTEHKRHSLDTPQTISTATPASSASEHTSDTTTSSSPMASPQLRPKEKEYLHFVLPQQLLDTIRNHPRMSPPTTTADYRDTPPPPPPWKRQSMAHPAPRSRETLEQTKTPDHMSSSSQTSAPAPIASASHSSAQVTVARLQPQAEHPTITSADLENVMSTRTRSVTTTVLPVKSTNKPSSRPTTPKTPISSSPRVQFAKQFTPINVPEGSPLPAATMTVKNNNTNNNNNSSSSSSSANNNSNNAVTAMSSSSSSNRSEDEDEKAPSNMSVSERRNMWKSRESLNLTASWGSFNRSVSSPKPAETSTTTAGRMPTLDLSQLGSVHRNTFSARSTVAPTHVSSPRSSSSSLHNERPRSPTVVDVPTTAGTVISRKAVFEKFQRQQVKYNTFGSSSSHSRKQMMMSTSTTTTQATSIPPNTPIVQAKAPTAPSDTTPIPHKDNEASSSSSATAATTTATAAISATSTATLQPMQR